MSLQLLFPLLAFGAGWVGGRFGVVTQRHADLMLSSVIWFGLPAVVLGTVSNLPLSLGLIALPLSAMAIILLLWPLGLLTGWLLQLPADRRAVVVLGAMIMNLAVVYPFCYQFWGSEGVALLALFDLGNGLLVLSLCYALAAWYGQGGSWRRMLGNLLRFPPLLVMCFALALNMLNIGLADWLAEPLAQLGGGWMLLVFVALGAFSVRRYRWSRELVAVVVMRSVLGGACGWAIGWWLDLEGLLFSVLVLGASAPVGFNTLVFAAKQGLDRGFAAELVCISLVLGLAWLPLVALLLPGR